MIIGVISSPAARLHRCVPRRLHQTRGNYIRPEKTSKCRETLEISAFMCAPLISIDCAVTGAAGARGRIYLREHERGREPRPRITLAAEEDDAQICGFTAALINK